MKKLLFFLIVFVNFGMELANAQTIAPTSAPSICNCFPANWMASSNFSKVSNTIYYGNQTETWQPALPPIPSGANTFFGIKSVQSGDNAYTKVSGLIPNKKYKFTYSFITARTNLTQGYMDQLSFGFGPPKSPGSDLPSAAFWTEHSHQFTPQEVGVWITKSYEFIAKEEYGFLKFFTSGVGHVGLDVSQFAIEKCDAGVAQVPVASTATIFCPATSLNLVTEAFQGLIPAGAQLKFYTTPDRSTLPLSNLNVGAGTYYAFYWDEDDNCYNTTYSTAKVDVTYKACPDLTPTLNIDALNFNVGAERDFIVNIIEKNGTPTSGNVKFRITKISDYDITYSTASGISKVFGGTGKPNENSNWTFTESQSFISVESTTPIPAKGKAVIGFHIKRKSNSTPALVQNMSPTILTNSGGEQTVDADDNQIVTSTKTTKN